MNHPDDANNLEPSQQPENAPARPANEDVASTSGAAVIAHRSIHVGPLPSPDDLARYEQIHKGAASTIIDMAVAEQKHGHAMERQLQEANIRQVDEVIRRDDRQTTVGQILSLVVVMLFLGVACYALSMKNTTAAISFGGISIATVVSLFLAKKRQKSGPEDETKEDTQELKSLPLDTTVPQDSGSD